MTEDAPEARTRWIIYGERLIDESPHIGVSLAGVQLPDGTQFTPPARYLPSLTSVVDSHVGWRATLSRDDDIVGDVVIRLPLRHGSDLRTRGQHRY